MTVQALLEALHQGDGRAIARAVTLVEEGLSGGEELLAGLDRQRVDEALVLGLTGPPGAGKSTLTSRLITELRSRGVRVGVLAIDPSSPISGGALLGDRVRMMDHALDEDVVVRSMATRGRLGGLAASAGATARIMAASGCRVVVIETVGIGQSEMDIVRLADLTLLVLAPGFGDDIQAMKAGILEVADLFIVNKADLPGAERLAQELSSLFGDPESRKQRVLGTVASEGRGVDELVRGILALEKKWRLDGRLARRRRRAREQEILAWAMEMVEQELTGKLAGSGQVHEDEDPRRAARRLVESLRETRET